jgi:hypothetical protein
LAQEIHRSIRSPREAKPDGRILWDLAGRQGLFNAPRLRQEMGEKISALAPLAVGELGEYGVLLPLGDHELPVGIGPNADPANQGFPQP